MSAEIAVALPETPATAPAGDKPSALSDNVQTPVTPEPPKEPQRAVDIKSWAKVSAENRALKAKTAELEAKIAAIPAPTTDDGAKLLESLKSPGAAKKLLEAGWTFDRIVAELTDTADSDPAMTEVQKIRAELAERDKQAEEARKAQEEAAAKERTAKEQLEYQAELKQARDVIAKHAETKGADLVNDDKDVRNGTPRWLLVQSKPELIETARAAVVKYITERYEKTKEYTTPEQNELLVSQALDQLEIKERNALKPLLAKLSAAVQPNHTNSRVVITESQESPAMSRSNRPNSIESIPRGPAPTKPVNKLFSGGPRRVTYSD